MSRETIRSGHCVVTVHSQGFTALATDQQAQWLARKAAEGDSAAQGIVDAALAILMQTSRHHTDAKD